MTDLDKCDCSQRTCILRESKVDITLATTLVVQVPRFSPIDNAKDFTDIELLNEVSILGARYLLVGIVYHTGTVCCISESCTLP